MSGPQRVGGPYELQAGGVRLSGKGGASYNLGIPKTKTIAGADLRGAGYTEEHQVTFIECAATDRDSLDVKALQRMRDVTVTMKVANGKTILLHRARYASEGTVTTEEGEIGIRFESDAEGEELPS